MEKVYICREILVLTIDDMLRFLCRYFFFVIVEVVMLFSLLTNLYEKYKYLEENLISELMNQFEILDMLILYR